METIIILALAVIIILAILYFWYRDRQRLLDTLQSTLDRTQQERLALIGDQQQERKELYDRIQAGTLVNFKENAQPEDNNEEVPVDTEDLEDAKDDIMGVEDDSDS